MNQEKMNNEIKKETNKQIEEKIKEIEKMRKKIKIVRIINVLLIISFYLTSLYYIRAKTLKPIIYLYPTEEMRVSVSLENPDKITCSYPKYTNGWNVFAKPNGDLTDLDTGKNLYSLYYESKNVKNYKVEKDGFVVKSEDIASFLEEKLAILGLNDKEKEEFIIYWLPKLEENKYTYIRFATLNEIENNMPVNITPKPDTFIRIVMTFKGLSRPIKVEEQELKPVEREGFVAVEWGGSEIK